MTTVASGVQSASKIQMDYLNLLVTQLKNQNPMEPMDNSQMTSQLAQLSQLQQMENLNSSFAKVLTATQTTQANELIGRQGTYLGSDGTSVTGTIDSVNIDSAGVTVRIGNQSVAVGDLTSIST
jgi:flagellar basal-body rod modification protein FlgD